MLFLKARREDGESLRITLAQEGLLDTRYSIIRQDGWLLIPVKQPYLDHETVELEAEPRETPLSSMKDALNGVLSPDELEDLNKSFDIIGDIALIEIPKGLQIHDRIIGEALMRVNRHVKAVFRKESAMEGEYRVRRIKHIAGEDRSETIYRESGVDMELDISKVYFSVRLSTERKRIADLASPSEKILVLFAGVGPFALVIAKRHPGSQVTALELNPDAVAYMRKNVSRNRLRNIEVIEGDARDFKGTGFDRIVMPLPKSAIDFLPIALSCVREGGIVHLYTFASTEGDPVEEALGQARSIASGSGSSISLIRGRIVRPYAPKIVQVVLDLHIHKEH